MLPSVNAYTSPIPYAGSGTGCSDVTLTGWFEVQAESSARTTAKLPKSAERRWLRIGLLTVRHRFAARNQL
jgi:hypothetical protein